MVCMNVFAHMCSVTWVMVIYLSAIYICVTSMYSSKKYIHRYIFQFIIKYSKTGYCIFTSTFLEKLHSCLVIILQPDLMLTGRDYACNQWLWFYNLYSESRKWPDKTISIKTRERKREREMQPRKNLWDYVSHTRLWFVYVYVHNSVRLMVLQSTFRAAND